MQDPRPTRLCPPVAAARLAVGAALLPALIMAAPGMAAPPVAADGRLGSGGTAASLAGESLDDGAGDSFVLRPLMAAEQFEVDGVVQAVRHTTVAAQVAGEILHVAAQAGDPVEAGALLLQIDGQGAERSQAAAASQLREAESALALARAELARQQALHRQRYISQAAYEQALARYRAAQAQAAARRELAGAAGAQAGHFLIQAPYAGIVDAVEAQPGDMVMPGKPLLRFYDPAHLRIEAPVPQGLMRRLAATARLQWPTGADPGLPGMAAIQILPTVDPATLAGRLRLALPPAQGHPPPGTPVRLRIDIPDTSRPRLMVPARAILWRGDLHAVLLRQPDGKAVLRQVRIGQSRDGRVEVLSGLQAGERVLRDPAPHARNGD